MAPPSTQKPHGLTSSSKLPRGAALLWLALAVLILLSVPLFALLADLRAQVAQLRNAAAGAQVSGAVAPSSQALAALQAGAARSMATEDSLEGAADANIAWRAVLERVVPAPSAGVRITCLRQHGLDLTVEGVAADDPSFRAYLGRLQGTPLIDLTTLQASTSSASAGSVAFSINARLRSFAR